MKNLLILGASMLQVPAIIKAKAMGYSVGVVDYDPNAPGIQYADKYFNISTIDTERIVDTAKRFGAHGVMTLATDMPVRSVAAACEVLGLPGISYQTAVKSTDKGEMMKAFRESSVAHPWFYVCSSFDELNSFGDHIEYPCIVKPTDCSGSRGVTLVGDSSELKAAYEYSKNQAHNGKVIVQEYLRGDEISVEVIVRDDIPHILAITDKITSGAPHFVEMGHSQPSRLTEGEVRRVMHLVRSAIHAVGIDNGPAHVELMVTENGPVMIELGARLGGDYIATHLVPLSTGIDMVEAVINQACGNSFDLTPKYSKVALARYFHSQKGVIEEVRGIDNARAVSGVQDVIIMKETGDVVTDITCSNDRVGVVIARGEDLGSVDTACHEAIKRIRILTK